MAVGNEIRWSDLCMLKDDWEEKGEDGQSQKNGQVSESERSQEDGIPERSYRVSLGSFLWVTKVDLG